MTPKQDEALQLAHNSGWAESKVSADRIKLAGGLTTSEEEVEKAIREAFGTKKVKTYRGRESSAIWSGTSFSIKL